MFLFGVEFVFACYIGVRLYEKFHSKVVDKPKKNQAKRESQGKSLKLKQIVEDGEHNLHYMKMSGLSVGLAWLSHFNPVFLPAMLLVFTYTAFPYLRRVENSLLKKKKVDGYVLYGIADFMTLGLGRLATAAKISRNLGYG